MKAWRESGLEPEEFAEGKGFKGTSLRWAESWLRHHGSAPRVGREGTKRTARPVAVKRASPSTSDAVPQFVPVRRRLSPATGEVVVEVGAARIRVVDGFDVTLLGNVVRALQAGGR